MYPHERSLVKQLKDKPFEIIGVNSDSDLDELRETLKEKNLSWRSFQNKGNGGKSISDEWQVSGWPTMYILDGEGKIRYANIRGRDQIDAAITELLTEMGHEVVIEHGGEEEDGEEEDGEEEDGEEEDGEEEDGEEEDGEEEDGEDN